VLVTEPPSKARRPRSMPRVLMSSGARARAATLALATVIMASCATHPEPAPHGFITGNLFECSGAVHSPAKGHPVSVRIEQAGHLMESRRVPAPGPFRISITPGTYVVAATGVVPVTVRVISGQTARPTLTPTRYCRSVR